MGKRLAFALRETIRNSSGYRLAQIDNTLFAIHIVTFDPDKNASTTGLRTVGSVTYTMSNLLPIEERNPQSSYSIFLSSSVFLVGSSRVEEQAKEIIAYLDENAEFIMEQFKRAGKRK